MKKNAANSQPANEKQIVRKVRGTRFVLNRVRLMRGLSMLMMVLMISTITLTMNTEMKNAAAVVTQPMTQATSQTAVETTRETFADQPSASIATGEAMALSLPTDSEMVDYEVYSRSVEVMNRVKLQQSLATPAEPDEPVVYYIAVNEANIRERPVTTTAVIDQVTMGDQVNLLALASDWSLVTTASGQTGYVMSRFLSETFVAKPTPTPEPIATPTTKPTAAPTTKPTAAPTPKPTAAPTPKPTAAPTPKPTAAPAPTTAPAPVGSKLTSAQKQDIIALAKAQLGKRYVYGGASPSVGFDCSGLTLYIYKSLFNVNLPHSSREQAKKGIAVSKSGIEVGDIICFDWDSPRGVVDHVGIYIGGGQYIHASSSRGKVVQSTLDLSRNPIVTIRRIIH